MIHPNEFRILYVLEVSGRGWPGLSAAAVVHPALKPSQMGSQLRLLERRGLIERSVPGRRPLLWALTDAGRDVVRADEASA